MDKLKELLIKASKDASKAYSDHMELSLVMKGKSIAFQEVVQAIDDLAGQSGGDNEDLKV